MFFFSPTRYAAAEMIVVDDVQEASSFRGPHRINVLDSSAYTCHGQGDHRALSFV